MSKEEAKKEEEKKNEEKKEEEKGRNWLVSSLVVILGIFVGFLGGAFYGSKRSKGVTESTPAGDLP